MEHEMEYKLLTNKRENKIELKEEKKTHGDLVLFIIIIIIFIRGMANEWTWRRNREKY